MRLHGITLVLPDKSDPERDAVAASWEAHHGRVMRLARFWDPPALEPSSVRLYGADTFCLVVAQKLGLTLVSPADELLLTLPPSHLKRRVECVPLATLAAEQFPTFAKPASPKLFRAGVYRSLEVLSAECKGLAPDTAVLISERVAFVAEARAFVLDGVVLDCALYEGDENVLEASRFASIVAAELPEPRTFVVDMGLILDRGWAVVEFNATWGAGLNGTRADLVLPAIAQATTADVRK